MKGLYLMKRLLSLVLLVCLASFGMMLTSCDEHDHEFSEDWAYNSTHHWHYCVTELGSGCDSTSDKGEHTWEKSVDGEDTYLCTVCGALKGYPVTVEEWMEALDESTFTNVTIKYSVKENDVTKNYVAKIAEGKIYLSEEAGGTITENWYEGEEADNKITNIIATFTAPMISSYYKFHQYVENGEGYYLTADIISELTGEPFGSGGMIMGGLLMSGSNQYIPGEEFIKYMVEEKGRIRFNSEGKLVLFSAIVKKEVSVVEVIDMGEGSTQYHLNTLSETIQEVSFTLSDYGTTTIPAK